MNRGELKEIISRLERDLKTAEEQRDSGRPLRYEVAFGYLAQSVEYAIEDLEEQASR